VSEFKNGAFEQTLNGSIFRFPIPGKSNTANPSAADSSAAGGRTNPANQTAASSVRTGLNLSADSANAARRAFAATDPRLTTNAPSVTGSTPTSALAKGTQQILNPPTVYGEPTLTQLQGSQEYIAARRGGATPELALQTARNGFAERAGGSPVTSNGVSVATRAGAPSNRLPNGASNANNPSSVTNAGNQLIAKEK
jgi:hypothetical protein